MKLSAFLVLVIRALAVELHPKEMPVASEGSRDELGRVLRLSADEIRERNDRALAALDALEEVGDESEQRETLDYLMRVVDDDRMSNRLRFGTDTGRLDRRCGWGVL